MANFLIAAHGLVASFLGAKALDPGNIRALDDLALLALVTGVLCAIMVLRPIRDTEPETVAGKPMFLMSKSELRCVTWRGAVPVDHVLAVDNGKPDGMSTLEALAREVEARARSDANFLDRRLVFVQLCGWLLAAQVLLWSAALVVA
jgi:hypothetical protein